LKHDADAVLGRSGGVGEYDGLSVEQNPTTVGFPRPR